MKNYDYIVPIGMNCRPSTALDDLGKRYRSLPFDWTLCSLWTIYQSFENDFKGFAWKRYFETQVVNKIPILVNKKYKVSFPHEEKMWTKNFKKKFDRRIKRLLNILNGDNNVLFVYNKVDPVLQPMLIKLLNDTNESMPTLDDLSRLIQSKFNLKFDILCIHYNSKITYAYFDPTIKTVAPYNHYDVKDITVNLAYDHYGCKEYLKDIKLKDRK